MFNAVVASCVCQQFQKPLNGGGVKRRKVVTAHCFPFVFRRQNLFPCIRQAGKRPDALKNKTRKWEQADACMWKKVSNGGSWQLENIVFHSVHIKFHELFLLPKPSSNKSEPFNTGQWQMLLLILLVHVYDE